MTLENGRKSYRISRRRHTPEQVVRKLREADRLLGEGIELPDVYKALDGSEQTYHRWRNQFGGIKADDVKRLKELEAENGQSKRIVAGQVLENQALREVNRGNW
jgi:putative transposase